METSVKHQGFTLLEMLVSVGIIAILVSVVTVSYNTAQKKGRDARRRNHLELVQQAFEQYAGANAGSYPANCTSAGATYLPGGMPTDPKTKVAYSSSYGASCTASAYCICAALEGETNNTTSCSGGSPPSGYKGFVCIRNLQ